MIRKIAMLLVIPMIAMSFAACGAQQDEYVGVCVDPNTEQRLDDDACDDDESEFLTYAVVWYMLANSSRSYPAVGGHVTKSYFRTTKPKGASIHYGLPKEGGTSVKSYSSKTSWGGKSSYGGSKSGTGGSKSSFGGSRSGRR